MQKGKSGRKEKWYERFLRLMRENKRVETAVYGALIAIVAGLYLLSYVRSTGGQSKTAVGETAVNGTSDESQLEARLESILSRIRGAGEVRVMITYETGPEVITAMSSKVSGTSTQTDGQDSSSISTNTSESSEPATVHTGDGYEPIVLYEKQPTIRGVIVVAEGAADIAVRLDLQRAVQAVLDIPLENIEVFECDMTNGGG